MTQDWPVALLIVLMGPVAGSFLGVYIDRWSTGRSLWRRSACGTCGTALSARDLVPLLSGLSGRCRHCGAAIPGHLLRIELAALGVSGLTVWLGRDMFHLLALAVFMWALVGLFYADLLHLRLPNALNGTLLAAGLALAALDPARDVWEGLAAAAAGAGSFAVLRWGYRALRGREGLGLGDVKMMAGLGAGIGLLGLPLMVLIGALMGVAAALWEARQGGPVGAVRVPFGSCLAGAGLLTMLIQGTCAGGAFLLG